MIAKISKDPEVQAHYERCLRKGTSPKLAEMFATGQTPGIMTDSVFLEGHCNGSQFQDTPHLGDAYAAEARRQGVDITGKVYLSGLARYPGDPEAWVSSRGEVARILDQRGWGAEGAVTRKVTKVAEPNKIAVAEDLIQNEMETILENVENPTQVDTEDLREQIIEKRKPHWAK